MNGEETEFGLFSEKWANFLGFLQKEFSHTESYKTIGSMLPTNPMVAYSVIGPVLNQYRAFIENGDVNGLKAVKISPEDLANISEDNLAKLFAYLELFTLLTTF